MNKLVVTEIDPKDSIEWSALVLEVYTSVSKVWEEMQLSPDPLNAYSSRVLTFTYSVDPDITYTRGIGVYHTSLELYHVVFDIVSALWWQLMKKRNNKTMFIV